MFFIPEAMAAGAEANNVQGVVMNILPMILIFVAFWFFLIRPQQKRQKEHAALINALTVGDEVMTMGGIAGRIVEVEDSRILMQIAAVDGKQVNIWVNRPSVNIVLPKGTIDFETQSAKQ